MKRTSLIGLLCLGIGFLFTATAQGQGNNVREEEIDVREREFRAAYREMLSKKLANKFPGGTLADFINYLQRYNTDKLEIVVEGEKNVDFGIHIPGFETGPMNLQELFERYLSTTSLNARINGPLVVQIGHEQFSQWSKIGISFDHPNPYHAAVTFDFPGGSIEKFVAFLGKYFFKTKFVIDVAADTDLKVPPFKIRQAKLEDIIKFVSASMSNGKVSCEIVPRDGIGEISVVKIHGRVLQRDKYEFSNIKDIIDKRGYTEEQVIDAVRAAWKELDREEEIELAYYKKTHLLMCVGTRDQVDVMEKVISALKPPKEYKVQVMDTIISAFKDQEKE